MIPWHSLELYVILCVSLSAVMGVALISPALPILQDVFELSDIEAGYIITLYTFPAIFLAPLAGLLTDRIGRRSVLVPSLFVFGGGGLAVCLVDNYPFLLGLRVLQGTGSTALALISRTLVGDLYEGRTRNAVMGLNDAVLAAGAALFPFLGGILAVHRWYYPFLLYVFPVFVGLLTAFVLPKIHLDVAAAKAPSLKNGFELVRDRSIGLLLLATLLAFVLLYGAIQTVLPLHLNHGFDYPSDSIGLLISTMATLIATTSFFNGRLVGYLSSSSLILLGFTGYGIGLILIGAGATTGTFVLGLCLFGIGHGLTLPTMNTDLVRSVPTESRGTLMSVRTILARLGQTTGPILFPLLGGWLAYSGLLVITGSLTLTGALLGILLTRISRDPIPD